MDNEFDSQGDAMNSREMSDQDYLDLLHQTQVSLPGATLDEVRTVIALRWAHENRVHVEQLRDEIQGLKNETEHQVAELIKSFFDLRQSMQSVMNEVYHQTKETTSLLRSIKKSWARIWAFIKTYRATMGGFGPQFDSELEQIEREEKQENGK